MTLVPDTHQGTAAGGARSFPENLRRIRLTRFYSQAELARRSGVHAVTITRLETGATAPSTRTVRALAGALNVEPGELATPDEVAESDRRQRVGEGGSDVASTAGGTRRRARASGGAPATLAEARGTSPA